MGPSDSPRRGSAYAAAALQSACQAVACAEPGTRGVTLFREACGVGSVLHLGDFGEADAAAALIASAPTGQGLSDESATTHVMRGLARGQENPRTLAPSTPLSRPPQPRAQPKPTAPGPRRKPHWLPAAEADRFWDLCQPVAEHEDAAGWASSRNLDPDALDLWGLARVLGDGELPPWARCGPRDWRRSEHLLIVPTVDASGDIRGFRARAVGRQPRLKELAPTGVSSAGLILACPLARQVLAQATRPSWWASMHDLVIYVAEGVPDFLSLAMRASEERAHGPAVIGIGSGAWTKELAARIPDGTHIVLCPHADAAGRSMIAAVGRSLAARCRVSVFGAKGHAA